MRPRLIAETTVPGLRWVEPIAGAGWVVTQPETPALTVLDTELRTLATVGLPAGDRDMQAAADDTLLAVGTGQELIALERDGQIRWRRSFGAGRPDPHFDDHGVLWVHLPPADELLAVEAATGREIDRVPLDSTHGGALFTRHAGGEWTGLHVAMGQDGSQSWLVRLDGGKIVLRELAGECVTGFLRAGELYFSTPHNDEQLSIREVATDAVVAEHAIEDVPGLPELGEDLILLEAATVVSDDFVLVAVNTDDFDTDLEDHLLLSTSTLGYRATMLYPYEMTHNSIYPADAPGRWLTVDYGENVLRLWQLEDEPEPGLF
ncbi:hypothetical protein [Actinoplanes friuliensis]|uniref:Uncharacterized protein n=1 Tax=Actinoplanes friuliensis DSM 7358 TaxID=1246995 RepID=U5VRP9_9ACTN|nr:hypothetical protein [Actinoplanes friuliensis]AGZ39492.1 hypothetical protein AFR_06015 [Actinoplanes friuliensis DSM 7358]